MPERMPPAPAAGQSHQAAVNAVRKRPSLIPPPQRLRHRRSFVGEPAELRELLDRVLAAHVAGHGHAGHDSVTNAVVRPDTTHSSMPDLAHWLPAPCSWSAVRPRLPCPVRWPRDDG
ncbi:hypothetical protein GCM10010430_50480 [Kitasatospora cystarginea]|uniref:Uncharacterized protein n=2 Tax=Streptomycetaceae TaxID=2062 RepID=A0ABN3EJ92_9ACTN